MTDNKRWHELHPRGLGDLLGTGAVRKVVESWRRSLPWVSVQTKGDVSSMPSAPGDNEGVRRRVVVTGQKATPNGSRTRAACFRHGRQA